MRHFWQWFCGYVCILLSGRQINRFLNLCSKNHIRLWKISRDMEHSMRMYIGLKDFYYLKPYLRKTKTKMKILSKKGFPFWCYRHPKLKWLFVFFAIGIVVAIYQFQFIWHIEIHGNENISTYDIVSFLEEINIQTGIKRQSVDCSNIEYELRQNFKTCGWVSVYVNKTKLCIEIKESLYDIYEMEDGVDELQYDLVAESDAVIHSIVTRRGIPLVVEGQSIEKGDTLVLGQCEIFDDAGNLKQILSFRADALIYARRKRMIQIPLSELEIFALKHTNNFNNERLLWLATQKIEPFLEKLEENGVIILDKNVMIDKKEKNIVFIGEITTIEQFGINIPVEEQLDYEFE